jgi:hypothetical protein
MSTTALDIIRAAMEDVGAVFIDDTLPDSEAQLGLRRLNWMLSTWAINGLMVRATKLDPFALTGGKYAYTIGISLDFNTSKPIDIVRAFVRDTNDIDYPMDVISRDEYEALDDKAFTSARPTKLYYDPGDTQQATQTGTVNLYPIPDAAGPYTLYIDQYKTLAEFSAITDVVTFEKAYYEALLYNLEQRLWRVYNNDGKPVPHDLLRDARRSMRDIENLNSRNARQMIMRTDIPGTKPGSFNIYSQDYD